MLTREFDQVLLESYSEDIPTFLKKIYAARSVSEAQLSLGLSNLLTPNFDQLDQALSILEKALLEQK
ncbi:MAG: single-stranded-DNA-specific exonuclease RecJ, partial [Candidatus Thioglobus sp.]|nr:single-stranded-DNA-specific exonuclease RecJ [Candidatus Thioglobus sp.]